MRKGNLVLPVFCVSILITSCSMPVSGNIQAQSSTSTLEITHILQQTSLPTRVVTDIPTLIPTEPQPFTPTPFVPFTVAVWADNVNVRTNPGYLFPSLRQLAKDTPITVMGKAPGGEWMYVQTNGGMEGWVFSQLIQSDIDLESVPLIEPDETLLIKGHVADLEGNPIRGVGFSIYKGSTDLPAANHVLSDAEGNFYSFMPTDAMGDWLVVQDSIACASNVWIDDSCTTYKGLYKGLVEPQSVNVTIPQSTPIEFLWR